MDGVIKKEDFPVEPLVIQGEELAYGRLMTMGKVLEILLYQSMQKKLQQKKQPNICF